MDLFRLKLKSLAFISAVDKPAQETAAAVLIKRDTRLGMDLEAKVIKLDEELGLVFCWAVTSKVDGVDYFDLQGDNVSETDLIKVAASFMNEGGAVDEMHDGNENGRVLFAMPWTSETAKAFLGSDFEPKTTGLMCAIQPSKEAFGKFKDGTYTGVSIAGIGERSPVTKREDALNTLLDIPGIPPINKEDKSMKNAEQLAKELAKALDENKTLLCRVERAEKMSELTEAEKQHYLSLSDDDKVQFLAKSASDRVAVVKSFEVDTSAVYTSAAGHVFTKADDSRLVDLAKRNDELEKRLEDEQLEKRAETNLGNLPGTLKVRAAILKAVDSIADEATRTAAHASIQAGDLAIKSAFTTLGSRGESLSKTARDFDKAVGDIMIRDNCSKSAALEKAAVEHAEAFRAYQEA